VMRTVRKRELIIESEREADTWFGCVYQIMILRPVIAICGTTGVGKSDLAIELASRLSTGFLSWKGARIINADSMQVYRGMDIITNKVSESERQGIEHLLMAFKEPGEQYVVGHWIQDAIKAVSSCICTSINPHTPV